MGTIEISEREIQLVASLRQVQGCLQELLRPASRHALVVTALDRGLSLREVVELVEATHQSLAIVLRTIERALDWSGWRGAWRRYVRRQSPSDPLARMAREAHMIVALRGAIRVIKALGHGEALSPDVVKLGEDADLEQEGHEEPS